MTWVLSEGVFGGKATITVKLGDKIQTFTEEEFAELAYPVFKALFSAPSAPPSC